MSAGIFAQMAGDIMSNIMQSEHDTGMQSRQHSHDVEMFNMQKAYNNEMLDSQVSRKMGDLRRAGLSPAFMNGSQIGASPLGVSPSSTSSVGNSLRGVNPVQGMIADAQIKNIDADTENKRLHAERQKIENFYLPALNESQVALNDSSTQFNISNCELNVSQKQSIAQSMAESEMRCAEIVGKLNIMQKEVEMLDVETRIKKIEESFKSREIQATIKNLEASANLSNTQARDIVKSFFYRMCNLEEQTNVYKGQRRVLYFDAASRKLQYNLDAKYLEPERIAGVISAGANAFGDCAESVTRFIPAGKAAKAAKAERRAAESARNKADIARNRYDEKMFTDKLLDYEKRTYYR